MALFSGGYCPECGARPVLTPEREKPRNVHLIEGMNLDEIINAYADAMQRHIKTLIRDHLNYEHGHEIRYKWEKIFEDNQRIFNSLAEQSVAKSMEAMND